MRFNLRNYIRGNLSTMDKVAGPKVSLVISKMILEGLCKFSCEMVVNEVKKFQELCMYQNNPQYCHHFITPKTVMILFYQLRGNKESFLNITQRTSLIDKVLLISFQFIATRYFIPYTKSNVMGLTAEIMYNYFHDTTIPELVHEEDEIIGNTRTKNSILKQCKLTNLCIGTIYRWMLWFCFKYSIFKKT